jgi:adenosine/AMP kinase
MMQSLKREDAAKQMDHTNPFIHRHAHLISVVNTMSGRLEFSTVTVKKPEDVNFILGQSHFIKTVEDIYEAVIGSVPGAKFGLAFCESSGDCLVRVEGNDEELKAMARDNALAIGAGHSFILFLRDCFPINVLNAIKNVQEVCTIYCATANPAEVVIAESAQGRGIMGVIDGVKPKGVEGPEGVAWRTGVLRRFGYKR